MHSLHELTRLLIGVASFSGNTERLLNEAEVGTPLPRPEQRRTHTLSDGRRVDYAVFGASGGVPVLFCHDEHCGDAWTPNAVEHAKQLGLEIIAPARPCYGDSDELPVDVDERRMQVARDTLHLLDTLGHDQVVCLARGMGAAVPMCLSSLQPERVLGIVSVAPALPVRDEDFKRINPVTRIIIHSLFHNRALARFITASRLRFARRVGVRAFMQDKYKDSAVDRELLAQPDIVAAIEQGARLCSQRGTRGFLGDVFDAGMPYERCVELIQSPTHVFVGEHDPNGRRERAAYLAELSNFVQVIEVPAAGDLIFYEAFPLFLPAVQGLFHGTLTAPTP